MIQPRNHLKFLGQLSLALLCLIQGSLSGDDDPSIGESEDTQNENAVPSNAFDHFQLILDRNIFDPERRPQRDLKRDRERRPEPPREESFSLIGTMSYADKQLAFFNASESEWSGGILLGESLAGHKVIRVDYDKVVLQYEGDTIELRMGAGRFRRGEESWQTQHISSASYAQSSSNRDNSSEDSDDAPDSDGPDLSELESNDILKQLMERRKQQMGQ
jgi:hypothetical protein